MIILRLEATARYRQKTRQDAKEEERDEVRLSWTSAVTGHHLTHHLIVSRDYTPPAQRGLFTSSNPPSFVCEGFLQGRQTSSPRAAAGVAVVGA